MHLDRGERTERLCAGGSQRLGVGRHELGALKGDGADRGGVDGERRGWHVRWLTPAQRYELDEWRHEQRARLARLGMAGELELQVRQA